MKEILFQCMCQRNEWHVFQFNFQSGVIRAECCETELFFDIQNISWAV